MKVCLSLLCLFWGSLLLAQQPTGVVVKVTDEKKVPLAGVSLVLKNSTKATITKDDGTATVNVIDPKTAVIVVNYTGYKILEIPVNGQRTLTITMDLDHNKLEDVIVVSALGLTRSARSVTAAQQTVDATNLTEARDLNLMNGLAGKVAGLQITGTGQPGGSSRMVLRGENSLSGNNQPLIVMDGVPINNSAGDAGKGAENSAGFLDYGNGVADINPDDVESITVMKGPNAAALYGSKAANGAIIITTKKSKPGGDGTLGIQLNQNLMFYTVTQWPAYQNIYGEGVNMKTVGNANQIVPGTGAINMGTSNQTWGAPMLGQPFNNFAGQPIAGGFHPNPDNVKDFYQSCATNTSNISLGKSDANSAFRLSYTYTKGNDVIPNTNLKTRHNLNLTASRKLGSRISIDTRLAYTYDRTKNRMVKNLDPANPLAQYVYMQRSTDLNALLPFKDANGNSISLGTLTDTENPYWSIYANSNEDAHNRFIGGVTATIELTKAWKFRGQIVGDLNFGDNYTYKELGSKKTPLGAYSEAMQRDQNWYTEGLFMYNKSLNKHFSLNGIAGGSLQNNNSLNRFAALSALLVHNLPSMSNSNTFPTAGETLTRTKQLSTYGSLTLAFNNYLFLDASARNEWSSTLPEANRSFFYPSLGMSFVFTDFLKNKSILSSGKLRANIAKVGGSTGAYQLINTFGYGGQYMGSPYLIYTSDLKNANLKPEQTVSREIGVDLSFLSNKINLTATVYKGNTTNQILKINTANETGFNSRVINAGEIRNKGIELSLNATVLQTKKFVWRMFSNFASNSNLVVSLTPGVPRFDLGSNLGVTVSATPGKPFGLLTGAAPYRVGDTILVGTNGRVQAEQNVIAGIGRPKFTGALGTVMKYGGFDLSVTATIRWGGSLYSASYGRALIQGTPLQSLLGRDDFYFSSVILGENDQERRNVGQTVGTTVTRYADSNRVKGLTYPNAYIVKTDPSTGAQVFDKNGRLMVGPKSYGWIYPQLVNGNDKVTNDVPSITYDASSIRISELILGYTLPQNWIGNGKGFVKGCRLAVTGRNLWQIFQKTPIGIDPESASSSQNGSLGVEAGGSFPYAQWGFDLKMTF